MSVKILNVEVGDLPKWEVREFCKNLHDKLKEEDTFNQYLIVPTVFGQFKVTESDESNPIVVDAGDYTALVSSEQIRALIDDNVSTSNGMLKW